VFVRNGFAPQHQNGDVRGNEDHQQEQHDGLGQRGQIADQGEQHGASFEAASSSVRASDPVSAVMAIPLDRLRAFNALQS
jgi:predicted phosphoribosyltransferase